MIPGDSLARSMSFKKSGSFSRRASRGPPIWGSYLSMNVLIESRLRRCFRRRQKKKPPRKPRATSVTTTAVAIIAGEVFLELEPSVEAESCSESELWSELEEW